MCEMSGAFFERPFLHCVSNDIRGGNIQSITFINYFQKLFINIFGKLFFHYLIIKGILAVIFGDGNEFFFLNYIVPFHCYDWLRLFHNSSIYSLKHFFIYFNKIFFNMLVLEYSPRNLLITGYLTGTSAKNMPRMQICRGIITIRNY